MLKNNTGILLYVILFFKSYKLRVDQIRTINKEKYRFKVNGKEWINAEELLKVGTYNVLIGETEHYKASEMDLIQSHKLFKRAIDVFGWEVIKVYSGPPVVAFKVKRLFPKSKN